MKAAITISLDGYQACNKSGRGGSAAAGEEEKLRTGEEAGRDSTAVLGEERGEGAERAEGAGEDGRE